MELITFNAAKAVKRRRSGRDFWVAPMTMIVPGVLNGSQGPLYYSAEELAKEPARWNGIPIVVYHPVSNGVPISARDPDVLERSGVGQVFNTRFDGALRADGWFDVEETGRVDPRVSAALEAGQQLELSTGVYTSNVPAVSNSSFNGVPYTHLATNYRPDHLAVLPDVQGACGIDHGCGVLVNSRGVPVENELSHDDVRGLLSRAMRSRYRQDEPHCYIYDVYDDYFVYEHGGEMYRLGYSRTNTGVTLSASDPVQVVRQISFVPATNSSEGHMPKLTPEQRGAVINHLVTNCSCWKGPNDRLILNGFDDDKLTLLKETADKLAANSAPATPPAVPPIPTVPAVVTPAPVPVAQPISNQIDVASLVSNMNEMAKNVKSLSETVQALNAEREASRTATKASLIGTLTRDLPEASKAALTANYETMTVEQLSVLAANAPRHEDGLQFRPAIYAPAGGPAQVSNAAGDEVPLPLPEMDYEEESEYAAARRRKLALAE